MLVASSESHFYGGIHYRDAFKPAPILEKVENTIDTSQTFSLSPFSDEPLPGPKRYFFDEKTNKNAHESLLELVRPICHAVGYQVLRPTLTVMVYGPNVTLAPHNDSGEYSSHSLLLTLQGTGTYDTFKNIDHEFIENCMNGIYPETATESIDITAGDIVHSIGSVIHGFRNNQEKRIVLGVLENT